MGTVIVGMMIALIVVFIIRGMVHNKKQHKSITGCDGNCGHCNGQCH